jgi:hypothetical protein
MLTNPILDAIHETREKLLLESGGTLAGLVERLRAEEKASGRRMWTPQRTDRGTVAAPHAVSTMDGQSSPIVDQ